MNEKELNEQRKQDQGLKAALERWEKNRPQMPQGLNERVMRKAAEPSRQKKSYWWAAAAACLLIVIGIGVGYQFSDSPRTLTQKSLSDYSKVPVRLLKSPCPITQKSLSDYTKVHGLSQQSPRPITQSGAPNHSTECTQSANRVQPISQPDMAMEEQELEIRVPADEAEPEVVYASVEIKTDTIFKAPQRMEEFVEKMAEFCKAEAADLDCLKIGEDSTQSRMYVIEDTQENEVFERLIQMAVWYDNDAPGYFLTFSQQQFLFQLHDPQQDLKYFVVAERINAKRILLFCTHAPLGKQINMSCYLEFRNKITNTVERKM